MGWRPRAASGVSKQIDETVERERIVGSSSSESNEPMNDANYLGCAWGGLQKPRSGKQTMSQQSEPIAWCAAHPSRASERIAHSRLKV